MDTKKLRQKILDLAIHGKLVPQDPNDEPASVLLERIRAEKEQLIKEGKIKAPKKGKSAADTSHYPKEGPWELPEGWAIASVQEVFQINPKNSSNEDADAGFVPMANISDGFSDCFTFEIRPWKTIKSGFTHFADNDVAVAKISPCLENRKSFVAKELPNGIGAGTTELFVFRSSQIVPEYTLLFFKSDYFISSCVGTFNGVVGQQRASRNVIEELVFPIPPKSEQYRIVQKVRTLFDDIDVIDNGKNAVEESVAMCKAKILELAIHGKLVPQDASEEPAIELLKRINPNYTPSHNLHYGESLPTGWVCASYGILNQHRNRSINPMDSPNEQYELYSVPIYETGYPGYLTGKEIGSTKQAVEKGDVLLCKINPHLNRAWVVEHYNPKLKCIASSEWLVFQSDALCPDYARLFFMSPAFRYLMLSNVSGVGGSLMRARASAVDGYPIWVPPVNEQKRIVMVVKAYYKVLDDIVAGLH